MILAGEPNMAASIRFVSDRVLPAFRRAKHPVRAVLTDNGYEWRSTFQRWCEARGIEHRRTKPGHCWTNGFVERLQGTILLEHWRVAFRHSFFTSAGQLERSLQHYMRFYKPRGRCAPFLGHG